MNMIKIITELARPRPNTIDVAAAVATQEIGASESKASKQALIKAITAITAKSHCIIL